MVALISVLAGRGGRARRSGFGVLRDRGRVTEDIEERLAETHGIIDPDHDSEPLRNAVAVATYLAFRRDELNDQPDDLIRRATKAEDVA